MKMRCKAVFALLAVCIMVLAMGCANNANETSFSMESGQSDLEYVVSKGVLVVGVTDYAPMDYPDEEDWSGFDADLARAFADSIGVKVELVEIDWDKKTELLENGSIDCIWNGMTLTDELQNTIACSDPYLSNAQVVVMRSKELAQYDTIESCQHLLFAVETGSAAETLLKDMKYRYVSCLSQKAALESVCEKKADASIIDIIMASYYIDLGQDFDALSLGWELTDEKICVGFRKDSDLTEKANAFLASSYEDGTIQKLAEQYGIESAVLSKTDE